MRFYVNDPKSTDLREPPLPLWSPHLRLVLNIIPEGPSEAEGWPWSGKKDQRSPGAERCQECADNID